MNRVTKLMSASLAVIAVAGIAFAQDALTPTAAHEAREAHMKLFGAQIQILGGMAQQKVPYDAAAAGVAATTLLELTKVDRSTWFPLGSDSDAPGIEGNRALPLIWTAMDDVNARFDALTVAATAMQATAGTDLASLQAAIGPLGGTCGGCHELYRKPE